MLGWTEIGPKWTAEDCYRVLQILEENRITCKVPDDNMFFTNPFSLPRSNRRWGVRVRRKDRMRALALLALEGLAKHDTIPI